MTMGKCSVYSNLQANSKVKFAAWPWSWQPPGADWLSSGRPKVNSCIWLRAVVHSTINIVLFITLLLLLLLLLLYEVSNYYFW